MLLTQLKDEDYVNYKLPSMFLATHVCERNCFNCQNQHLKESTPIVMHDYALVKRYLQNPLTKAIVIGGLEPFDTYWEIRDFYQYFRKCSQDPVVFYTGYEEYEIEDKVKDLTKFGGTLIIKYGCYIDGHESHYDEVLGVNLASNNQYAREYKMKLKIKKLYTDEAIEVAFSLATNDGYCPCKPIKVSDTKCMCKEFREQNTEGICHCGLFMKEFDSE